MLIILMFFNGSSMELSLLFFGSLLRSCLVILMVLGIFDGLSFLMFQHINIYLRINSILVILFAYRLLTLTLSALYELLLKFTSRSLNFRIKADCLLYI